MSIPFPNHCSTNVTLQQLGANGMLGKRKLIVSMNTGIRDDALAHKFTNMPQEHCKHSNGKDIMELTTDKYIESMCWVTGSTPPPQNHSLIFMVTDKKAGLHQQFSSQFVYKIYVS